MDQQQAQADFHRLSDSDKRDLQQSINNEMQKAKIQECEPVCHSTVTLCTFSLSYPNCLLLLSMPELKSLPQPTAPARVLTTDLTFSRPRTHRHLLEEVCYGEHLIKQLGQERGAVYTELRGEVYGRE